MKKQHHMTADILILGAGIGGYETFRSLAKRLKKFQDRRITIVDKNNYFTFVPMLHEAATGSIEPTHCAIPLRALVAGTPHTFCKASIEKIDPAKKIVHTSLGTISYNVCVIALGSTTNYFHTPGAKEHSEHVRTLDGAMHLKHTFIDTIETCGDEPVSLNIVGGGYTGIEVAGQYADLAKKDLKKLYPHKKIVIRILQAGDTILPYMPIKVQKKVTKKLTQEGVLIDTQTKVTKVTKQSITLSDGRTLPSDITIWTAGFETEGKTFLKTGTNDHGRVSVTGELLMEGYDHTYALGDIAHIQDPKTNIAYPQLAEAAYHEGQYAAKHIARSLKHKHTGPFRFHSKGQLMPVGDWYGVAQIGPFLLFGKLAWWIRRTVYVLFMPGFLRKIRIVFDWTIHSFGVRDVISVDVANVEKRM
ncbi:MAG TPA: hypothetical protein DEP63_01855 [Candidatus Magasanikbacteria bacterium]|nr:hypothetical protein [Candidatus Magasanikbacteria bacterium]HCC13469.1 hypothetical protein [Candidatus Magasanikbacteria bacterium]